MAAAAYKYARPAMYGSSAYDLNTVRVRETEERVYERELSRETVYARPAVRAERKPSKLLSAATVICCIAAAAMLVFVILSYAVYTDVKYNTSKLTQQLEELEDQRNKLLVKYENTFDMDKVEQYATTVLGMTAPTSGQVGRITTLAADHARVLDTRQEQKEAEHGLISFIASLTEYF